VKDSLDHVMFAGGGETSLHPLMLVALIIGGILILALPRRYAVIPLLCLSIPIPMAQTLMVGSFHFQVYRIVILFAWTRILYEKSRLKSLWTWNPVDTAVLGYAVVCIVTYTLLWQQSAAFFGEVGKAYGIVGYYFAFRFFLRDRQDVDNVIKTYVWIAVFVAIVMINEQMTGHNALSMFGAPELSAVRDGYIRAQGPFSVYLTAGAFGATLIPLFLCLWRRGGSIKLALLGLTAGIVITLTCKTSTAISACLAVVIGLAMWGLRGRMKQVRWAIVSVLTAMHLVMKAPVWALLARVDIVGGSTGWHRFKIVDNFVHHFWDWFLLGSNNYWTWEGGDDMWDTANQYVATGETFGLLALILFIATIVYCFKYLGHARKASVGNRSQAWFFWLMGVALFANLIAFLGIDYFDQSQVYWYSLLAMIVAATLSRRTAIAPIASMARPESETEIPASQPDTDLHSIHFAVEGADRAGF